MIAINARYKTQTNQFDSEPKLRSRLGNVAKSRVKSDYNLGIHLYGRNGAPHTPPDNPKLPPKDNKIFHSKKDKKPKNRELSSHRARSKRNILKLISQQESQIETIMRNKNLDFPKFRSVNSGYSPKEHALISPLMRSVDDMQKVLHPIENRPDEFLVLHGLIGKGSFGEVFLVQNEICRSMYAMKVLNKTMIKKHEMLRYALSEKEILANLDHPFIVKLRFAFQNTQSLYLLMDYIPCGNLSELIEQSQQILFRGY